MTTISTAGLTKHYGSVRALEDLDLDVGEGEVFGFLGPNGAGKTTTIRLLMGLINATRGTATVLGRDARRDAVDIHRRVGYLPSDPAFPRGTTARTFLDHVARLRGGLPRQRIEALAERLGLDLGKPIDKLSHGNRQKVGVVQAFMHEPDLVVLDEPSSGLDPLKQMALNDLVRETAAAGGTVFFSSHVIAEVEQLADRVGIVRGGSLVAVADVATLKQRALRRVTVRFAHPIDPAGFRTLPGVEAVEGDGATLVLVVAGAMDAVVKAAARHQVESFTSDEPDLADVFLSYYDADDAAPATP